MSVSLPALDDQTEAIAFLSDPASYGLPGGRVERVETHCSVVFLAGDRAYKLKRALRYAALDYTTRDLRRTACAAELRLNRRTAPQLYLDTFPITRQPGGALAFNGDGAPVDYVVVMRRFAQADLFDQLAETGGLTVSLMAELGETIASFHHAAETMSGFGGSAAVRREIASNDIELAKVATELDGAAVGTLSSRSRTALDGVAPLLDARAAQGKVRRCHGDLRLANICLYDGHPTLFDCIEFSDEVSCIDVLHDLAFLLMDLHLRHHDDLANAVFNSYLDVAPETSGLRALPLFLALRAATRSFALAGSARRQHTPQAAERQHELARQHIAAGLDFLHPPPPRLVTLGGGSTAQRAEWARRIAATMPAAPGARMLSLGLGRAALMQAEAVLAAGWPVVLEGAFDSEERAVVAARVAELGISHRGFWLGSSPRVPDRSQWRTLDPRQTSSDALARQLDFGPVRAMRSVQ